MRGSARAFLFIGAAILPSLAIAQTSPVGSSAQGDVAVTIYPNGNTLVQDTRQLNLPAGVSRQDFPDVSAQIRPETVRLSANGTTIVEQNFDYDLLSPQALMQKAVGQTVTLVRTNPATGKEAREQAKILASNDGVVMQIGDRIEVLRDDGLPVRVVYASIPPNLRARPTLSVTLDTKAGGTRPVMISYLTNGLRWSSDYVVLFDEAKGAIDVQGWVTLQNDTDTPFVNADTLLVAAAPAGQGTGIAPGTLPGTETAARARLGDYYLYPLGHRTTIAPNQQKQVSFLSVGGVPAKKLYQFRNNWLGTSEEPRSAQTVLNFSSSSQGGLGDALPAGTMRIYIRDATGQPQFIGESRIGHTPMGSRIALVTGEAFDVKVKPVVVSRERVNDSRWRTTMRYDLTNARPEAVTVDVLQGGLDGGTDTRITSESLPSERRSAGEAIWHVPVPGNGAGTLNVVFDTRF